MERIANLVCLVVFRFTNRKFHVLKSFDGSVVYSNWNHRCSEYGSQPLGCILIVHSIVVSIGFNATPQHAAPMCKVMLHAAPQHVVPVCKIVFWIWNWIRIWSGYGFSFVIYLLVPRIRWFNACFRAGLGSIDLVSVPVSTKLVGTFDHSIGRLFDWSVGQLFDCFIIWLVDRLVGLMLVSTGLVRLFDRLMFNCFVWHARL